MRSPNYEIEVIPVYRVKGDYRSGTRTYRAILSRVAWKMIGWKYGFPVKTGKPFEYKSDWNELKHAPNRYSCDCHEYKSADMIGAFGEYHEVQVDSFWYCPVHDRQDGYLRRLHDRLVRFLLVAYPAPRLAEL